MSTKIKVLPSGLGIGLQELIAPDVSWMGLAARLRKSDCVSRRAQISQLYLFPLPTLNRKYFPSGVQFIQITRAFSPGNCIRGCRLLPSVDTSHSELEDLYRTIIRKTFPSGDQRMGSTYPFLILMSFRASLPSFAAMYRSLPPETL
jgi:hypothetical protein